MTTCTIEDCSILVRELPPDRMSFSIGAAGVRRRPRAVWVVRLALRGPHGKRTWGAAADRPSFGWLDKRSSYGPEEKLARLQQLVLAARDICLAQAHFTDPYEFTEQCGHLIHARGQALQHEPLSSSFAAALFERAIIDAVCRLQNVSLHTALRQHQLGFEPSRLHPELAGINTARLFPAQPRTQFHIRHTVGLSDPLVAADLNSDNRSNDGEPVTLEDYIRRDGLRFFKVKISGNPDADLNRLTRLWNLLALIPDPVITLDGNESYTDLAAFSDFVQLFAARLQGLFQHTAFIEQPLPRTLTFNPDTAAVVKQIARQKPLLIDEADQEPHSFRQALQLGYAGVSHKNCKGLFKSLANYCLIKHLQNTKQQPVFQSGEDLSNMPLVALHQDFAALGCTDITHCERNGHHYTCGLSHLSTTEKQQTRQHHPDLYTERADELFLNIRNGQINCKSLQTPGLGLAFAPDWNAMTPISDWEATW